MAIPFTCPHCGHHTDVQEQFAGKTGPCVSCGNAVTVPTIESIVRAAPSRRATTSAKKSPVWIKFGMICGALVSVGVLGVVIWSILQPALRTAREVTMHSECEVNLKVIGQALEDYHDVNGHYPPAVVRDSKGKAMHSWRVLLLPHLGAEAAQVYKEYDMLQPWDSAANSLLIDKIPGVYQCSASTLAVPGETSYLAIVGTNTLISSDSDSPTTRGQITDNPEETMSVVEASNSQLNWLEPKDVSVASLRSNLNSGNALSPGSEHPQGVNILMAEQTVICTDDVSSDDLRAMATIDGGEYIEFLELLDY